MTPNWLQIARKNPQWAASVSALFQEIETGRKLRELLGSCTCTGPSLACTCPPEYSEAKGLDYAGHAPETH